MDLSPFPHAAQPDHQNTVAIVLHGLLVLVIVTMFGVGVYMTGLPFSPLRRKLYNWHKWAGVTFLSLTVLRLLWHVTHVWFELRH